MKIVAMTLIDFICEHAKLKSIGGGRLAKSNEALVLAGNTPGFPTRCIIMQNDDDFWITLTYLGKPLKAHIDSYLEVLSTDVGIVFNEENQKKLGFSDEDIARDKMIFEAQHKELTDKLLSWIPNENTPLFGC